MITDGAFRELVGTIMALVQTGIALVLGYVAKLLRDIRDELLALDRRLSRTEVKMEDHEKLWTTMLADMQRRIERLENRPHRD